MFILEKISNKLKNKEYIQDILVNTVGDIILIILGLILGYYLKCMFI